MALTSRTEGHLLPCGRSLEDLWNRLDPPAESAADDHERSCPHCQTARSSLQALADATRAVFEDDSLTPPPALRGRIMAVVRAEVRRHGNLLPLPPGEFGPIEVSGDAVAVVLRLAADTVEGVRARHCRLHLTERPPGAASAEPADGPASVRVDLSIAIRYSQDTTVELVELVRDRVAAAAAAEIGLPVSGIDIEVEDVYRADH